jgi:hypothetical protein
VPNRSIDKSTRGRAERPVGRSALGSERGINEGRGHLGRGALGSIMGVCAGAVLAVSLVGAPLASYGDESASPAASPSVSTPSDATPSVSTPSDATPSVSAHSDTAYSDTAHSDTAPSDAAPAGSDAPAPPNSVGSSTDPADVATSDSADSSATPEDPPMISTPSDAAPPDPAPARTDSVSPADAPVTSVADFVPADVPSTPVVPLITSGQVPGGTVGVPYSFQLTSNVTPVTFVVSGLPDGLSVDPQAGLIHGIPTTSGAFTVNLEATSPENTTGLSQTYSDFVTIDPAPSVPLITSGPVPGGTVGVPYSFQLTSNVSPVTFVVSGLPDGLSVNPDAGLIHGIPTAAGTFSVTLEATSPENASSVSQTYVASVTIDLPPSVVPVITSLPVPGGTVGVPYSFQLTSNVSPVEFVVSGLPDGLSVDPQVGRIQGVPTAAGTFTVHLEATSPENTTGVTQSYDLPVTIELPPSVVPLITSGRVPGGTVGVPYGFQLTSNVSPVTFVVSGLPDGLSVDPLVGRIRGIPTAAGTFTVHLEATSPENTTGVSQEYVQTVTIDPGTDLGRPLITSGQPDDATVGIEYHFQLTASGDQRGLTFTESGLPAGLSLNATTGVISGVPTEDGTFRMTFGASRAGLDSDESLFTMVIHAATPPTNPPSDPPTNPLGAAPVTGSGVAGNTSLEPVSASLFAPENSNAGSVAQSRGVNGQTSGFGHVRSAASSELAETGATETGPILLGMLGLFLIAAGGVAVRIRRRRG